MARDTIFRLGCATGAALLMALFASYAVGTLLQPPSCAFDSRSEYSELAMMLGFAIGSLLLGWTAWRFAWWRATAGVAVPAATCAVFITVRVADRSLEKECRARSLPQALAVCGEKLSRYNMIRAADMTELTLKPGLPADDRFVCLSSWSEWRSGIEVSASVAD